MEKNNNNNIKTTTFNAQVAVSKTESGMDCRCCLIIQEWELWSRFMAGVKPNY